MPDTQTEVISNSPRKAKIMDSLKILVNDLTGIDPENIDLHANFLEAGIDSLTLIQATQLVKEQFEVKLSVVQLLEQLSNMDSLATYIDTQLPPDAMAEVSQAASEPAATPPAPAVEVAPPATPINSAAPQPSRSVITKTPEPPVLLPSVTNGPASALDQIMSQQLQLMAQQLEMMRAAYQNGGTQYVQPVEPQPAPPVIEQERPAVDPMPVPPAPAATAASPASSRTSFVQNQPAYIPYQPIEPGPTDGLTEKQRRHLDDLIARHSHRTRESKRLTQEYRRYLADSRSSFGFRLLWKELIYPIISDHSSGSKIWDVDGNEYVDISLGFGLHLFGHSPDFMMEAIQHEIDRKGLQLGPQVALAGKVARLISELGGVERVNFCNSGTEAVMGALRIARTVTRRSRVAIFAGAYHGWSDGTLAKTSIKKEQGSVPVAPGISAKAVEDVVVLPWNSPEAIEYLNQHAHELAAVMVEPVQSRRPDIQPREFLHELRRITARTGTALIFDEMVTGFRIHRGGAQAWFGVEADILIYGKVVGGGLPLGIVAGKAAFMDAFDGGMWDYGDESYPQAEKTIFAGAFFKQPMTMAAARVILERLRDNPSILPELNERTARLVATLNRYFEDAEVPITVVNFGSLFRFVLAPELKYADLFFYHMLDQGIYIWEGRNCFLSTAHTEDDLNRIVDAVAASVDQMRAGEFWPGSPRTTNGGTPPAQPRVEVEPGPTVKVESKSARVTPQFSLYYFGNYESEFSEDKYELLLEGAKYADEHGFEAVWIPERHFHAFGGFSPNPSVVAAALARETRRLRICAGSVVLPLHNPIRVAEEWSVVDNLSRGRIGISFASGWQPNDFVFAPDAFVTRHEHMYRGIEMVQKLWNGEAVQTRSGDGNEISIHLTPMPMQRRLPIWLTGATPRTFTKAGELGMRVLTNLQDKTIEELTENIALYRATLERHNYDPDTAHVTLLLHTFVTDNLDEAREKARQPLYRYMSSSFKSMGNLVKKNKLKPVDFERLAEEDLEYILANGYDRYTKTASLIGTPDSCAAIIDKLVSIGVNEIGCMVDFGVDTESVLGSLRTLNVLREKYQRDPSPQVPTLSVASTTIESDVRSIPLTDAQRQLWIHAQIGPDASRAYNESVTVRMRGPFDLHSMRHALGQLVERHELLRATFSNDGEHQFIHPTLSLEIPLVDFSHVPEAAREEEAQAWITREVGEPFDLEHGPLVRFPIVKMSEELHLFVFNNHHLVADGQSWPVLMKDLETFYSAARLGAPSQLPPPRGFGEYVERLHQIQSNFDARTSEDYWLKLFRDDVPVLRLPTDRTRPPVQTYDGKNLLIATDTSLFENVKKLCSEQRSTVYMMLLAAYSALLHRLSGQQKIIVGVPAAGQLAIGLKDSVGYCVNLMPLLSDTTGNPTFTEYLAAIKHRLMESLEHQHYSFGSLLKRLDIPWDASRSPLFTTIFNIDRAGSPTKFADLEIEVTGNSSNWARYDLRMNLIESDDKLLIDCTFNTNLFDESTIRRWMDHFQTLLSAICEDPVQRVQNLPLMTEAELRQLVVAFNDTAAKHPPTEGFHRLFEAQVKKTPDAIAVVFEDEQLSYKDLNVMSNRLARYLRRHGVGAETPVALYLTRSAEMIVALLAVMKAGGVYVPLDPTNPPERLGFTLADCGARVVLTHEQKRTVFDDCDTEVVCLDSNRNEWLEEKGENLKGAAAASNLAYIIYTSGSTGRPKGVCIEHRQLLNYVRSVSQSLSLPTHASFATVSTLAADLGHTMIFPALCGGTLHIITEDRLVNPDALAGYFERHHIDCLKIVPSHLEALLTAREPRQVLPRQRLILGGEATQPGLLARLGDLEPECEVFNHYGPTETTVGVLTFHAPKSRLQASAKETLGLPLGHPIANTRVYVLDAHGQPVPPGIYGELYVGGEGVARGYHNRPELTAERFAPDPFSGERGARLYRTGDVGRHLPGGEIEFAGRIDNQVKIAGQRIELKEIEVMLTEHEAVREAVVVARDVAGERALVAYVVTASEKPLGASELRQHLRQRLPQYMQPAAFVMLDKIPLTANGKIDRRALPAPSETRPEMDQEYEQPRTPAEEQLAQIWSEVLKLEQLGIHDNFFDLGGNSLLGTKMAARVRDRFQVELTLRNLFESPTIAQLSALIGVRQAGPEVIRPEVSAALQTSVDQLLSRVDHLPEAEVDSLLDKLLAEEEAM